MRAVVLGCNVNRTVTYGIGLKVTNRPGMARIVAIEIIVFTAVLVHELERTYNRRFDFFVSQVPKSP